MTTNCDCRFNTSIHPLLHGLSAHRCPISPHSSLGEFPGYWDWLWSPPAFARVSVYRLSLSLAISQCFSIHSSSSAIEFHLGFFFMTGVSALIGRPFTCVSFNTRTEKV